MAVFNSVKQFELKCYTFPLSFMIPSVLPFHVITNILLWRTDLVFCILFRGKDKVKWWWIFWELYEVFQARKKIGCRNKSVFLELWPLCPLALLLNINMHSKINNILKEQWMKEDFWKSNKQKTTCGTKICTALLWNTTKILETSCWCCNNSLLCFDDNFKLWT